LKFVKNHWTLLLSQNRNFPDLAKAFHSGDGFESTTLDLRGQRQHYQERADDGGSGGRHWEAAAAAKRQQQPPPQQGQKNQRQPAIGQWNGVPPVDIGRRNQWGASTGRRSLERISGVDQWEKIAGRDDDRNNSQWETTSSTGSSQWEKTSVGQRANNSAARQHGRRGGSRDNGGRRPSGGPLTAPRRRKGEMEVRGRNSLEGRQRSSSNSFSWDPNSSSSCNNNSNTKRYDKTLYMVRLAAFSYHLIC
jgi:hypothetical protein